MTENSERVINFIKKTRNTAKTKEDWEKAFEQLANATEDHFAVIHYLESELLKELGQEKTIEIYNKAIDGLNEFKAMKAGADIHIEGEEEYDDIFEGFDVD